jgi:hypothetical protein
MDDSRARDVAELGGLLALALVVGCPGFVARVSGDRLRMRGRTLPRHFYSEASGK